MTHVTNEWPILRSPQIHIRILNGHQRSLFTHPIWKKTSTLTFQDSGLNSDAHFGYSSLPKGIQLVAGSWFIYTVRDSIQPVAAKMKLVSKFIFSATGCIESRTVYMRLKPTTGCVPFCKKKYNRQWISTTRFFERSGEVKTFALWQNSFLA